VSPEEGDGLELRASEDHRLSPWLASLEPRRPTMWVWQWVAIAGILVLALVFIKIRF
jgi:hypothetical protein